MEFQSAATLQHSSTQSRREYDAAKRELKFLKASISATAPTERAKQTTDKDHEKLESTLDRWLTRVDSLRQRLGQNPQMQVPELKYLTEEDWLLVAFGESLSTDAEFRKAFERLRTRAKMNFGRTLSAGLKAYAAANNDLLPLDIRQLAPYIPADDDAALDRYKLIATGTLIANRNSSIIEERGPVDPEFDSVITVSAGGVGNRSYSQLGEVLKKARSEYQKATSKSTAPDIAEYLPYIKDPAERAILMDRISKNRKGK